MYDFPRTPQTLPCDDEDPFFVFHEDGSIDDSNIGVCVETSNTPVRSSAHAFFIPTSGKAKDDYRHTVRKELDFEALASKQTTNPFPANNNYNNNNDDVSLKSSKSLTIHHSMKNKRRLYRSKTFSPKNLSNKIKTAMQSPSRKSVASEKSGRHQRNNNNKDKTRLYHSLEDNDEDDTPLLPHDLDDRSCALSLPSRLVTSMSRKKKSSTTSLTSNRMWNKLILMDSLSTFKATPESTTTKTTTPAVAKVARSMAGMELASSSSSTESSCTSSLGGRKSLDHETMKRSQLQSRLQQGLYNARVDEEEDESSDSDSEDDTHPEAGSFAFAIRRRDSLDERGSF